MTDTKKFKTVKGVVDWRLCLGCGACAYICPDQKISLIDVLDEGIRPVVKNENCVHCTACLDVCPGLENDHRELRQRPGIDPSLLNVFGPVLEVWEGYAVDPEIRHRGASGGLITALALHCLEGESMHGVLHTGGAPSDPVRNQTRMSHTRDELLAGTGSRYSPASVCDGLGKIEAAPKPCAFIGQPVEVTALRKAQRLKPELDRNVGIAISFFCAGSPSTRGTLELIRSRNINPAQVEELRYRGLGWPGMFAVRERGETDLKPLMTYHESWGYLQRFRPFAVHTCPDNSGEDADISCADPWYREIKPGESGFSLVVVRTEKGRELLKRAVAAGRVHLEKADSRKVLQSQSNLAAKRAAIWGRIFALHLMGLPAPKLRGFSLFQNWLRSPLNAKAKSTMGTARRIIERGYRRPLQLRPDAVCPLPNGHGEPAWAKLPMPRKKAYRVCIMGASMATGNRGVSALGNSLVKLIKTAHPEAEVTFLLGLRQPREFQAWLGDESCPVPTVNFRMSPKAPVHQQLWWILIFSLIHRWIPVRLIRHWIKQRFPWIRSVVEADFVGDIRGGDSFSDIYGLRRFVVGSLPVLSVIWLRGRIALLPQTHGPFKSPFSKMLARHILRRATPIMSRDQQSPDTIRELLGRNSEILCAPDVAFVLPVREPAVFRTEPPLPADANENLVGLNVNGLMYSGGYTQKNMFGLKLNYPQFLVQLCDSLLKEPSRRLLLVPHTFAPAGNVESDPEACAKVWQQLPAELQSRVHVLQGEFDQNEIKGVIGRCEFFIGSRMHACIAALSQGIPTVGVAYSKKFVGVFQSVGAKNAVIDGRDVDAEEAVTRTLAVFSNRVALRKILAVRVAQAQKNLGDFFKKMLSRTSSRPVAKTSID
ncbi:MAG TPA: polysaccharide pyruvyl transferase family protein [Verrucomicrobiae bacterium]|nr:polysaccharide pyruvyl transferase family protein [Verrucomicrobiae bacterium]